MKKRGKFHILHLESVSEPKQGLIFYLCRCYDELPDDKRRILDKLYERIGGENAAALRAVMETDDTFVKICREHYIASQTTLYRLRAKLYYEFPFDEMMK